YDIAAQIMYKNEELVNASKITLDKVKSTGGDGGIIALDKMGNIAMEFNTAGMYRASVDTDGNLTIKIYKD
ncbi:MAG: isoaspartyl peptidase/L-asparaginase, partial [Bacteroidota bacterium]